MKMNLVFALAIVASAFLFVQAVVGFLSRDPSAGPDRALCIELLMAPPSEMSESDARLACRTMHEQADFVSLPLEPSDGRLAGSGSAPRAEGLPPSLVTREFVSPPPYIALLFLYGFLIAPPVLAILGLWNRSGLALKLTSVLAVPGSMYVFGGTTYFFIWGLVMPACILLAGIVRPARMKLAATLVGVGLAFPVVLVLGSLIL